jgi:hypothetical protein
MPMLEIASNSDQLAETLFGCALGRLIDLRLREADAEHLDLALARGVERHAAPAAADVKQPLSGLEVELRADQVELGLLGLFQRGGAVAPVSAAVSH